MLAGQLGAGLLLWLGKVSRGSTWRSSIPRNHSCLWCGWVYLSCDEVLYELRMTRRIRLEREGLRETIKATGKELILFFGTNPYVSMFHIQTTTLSLSTDTTQLSLLCWIWTFLCQLTTQENSEHNSEGTLDSLVFWNSLMLSGILWDTFALLVNSVVKLK